MASESTFKSNLDCFHDIRSKIVPYASPAEHASPSSPDIILHQLNSEIRHLEQDPTFEMNGTLDLGVLRNMMNGDQEEFGAGAADNMEVETNGDAHEDPGAAGKKEKKKKEKKHKKEKKEKKKKSKKSKEEKEIEITEKDEDLSEVRNENPRKLAKALKGIVPSDDEGYISDPTGLTILSLEERLHWLEGHLAGGVFTRFASTCKALLATPKDLIPPDVIIRRIYQSVFRLGRDTAIQAYPILLPHLDEEQKMALADEVRHQGNIGKLTAEAYKLTNTPLPPPRPAPLGETNEREAVIEYFLTPFARDLYAYPLEVFAALHGKIWAAEVARVKADFHGATANLWLAKGITRWLIRFSWRVLAGKEANAMRELLKPVKNVEEKYLAAFEAENKELTQFHRGIISLAIESLADSKNCVSSSDGKEYLPVTRLILQACKAFFYGAVTHKVRVQHAALCYITGEQFSEGEEAYIFSFASELSPPEEQETLKTIRESAKIKEDELAARIEPQEAGRTELNIVHAFIKQYPDAECPDLYAQLVHALFDFFGFRVFLANELENWKRQKCFGATTHHLEIIDKFANDVGFITKVMREFMKAATQANRLTRVLSKAGANM